MTVNLDASKLVRYLRKTERTIGSQHVMIGVEITPSVVVEVHASED